MRRGLVVTIMAAALAVTGAPAASAATHWTIQPTPSPSGANTGTLNGVSCIAASSCIAVGFSGTHVHGGEFDTPLAEFWNGTAWTDQTMPVPAGSTGANLNGGVSCTAASSCMAAGTYSTGTGQATMDLPLAESWNGSTWTAQPMPAPSGAKISFVDGVSCASASSCTAVGSYFNTANLQVPFAESWDGSNWTVQIPPAGRFTSGAELLAVSCAAPGQCTAVGNYFGHNRGSSHGLLAEHLSAGTWRIQAAIAAPAGTVGAELGGVSCVRVARCTAVGDFATLSGTTQVYHPLAESWDGSTWTAQSVPGHTGSTATALDSVSCTAKSNCTATGTYFTQGAIPGVVAVAYHEFNGAWQVQATGSPASKKVLAAISCTSATSCTAVGWHRLSLYQPLAEQR